jgi:hypothetical protein
MLSWTRCPLTPGARNDVTFDCNPANAAFYDLFGTFEPPAGMPDLAAAGIAVDFQFEGRSDVPDFWHREAGGCNTALVNISDAMPSNCTNYTNPWGPGGAASDAFVTGYSSGFGGRSNVARLVAAVARSSANTVKMVGPPIRYYAFHLTFYMDNAEICTGCNSQVSVVWKELLLEGPSGGKILIRDSDAGSLPGVTINGTAPPCIPPPGPKPQWQTIRSLYR